MAGKNDRKLGLPGGGFVYELALRIKLLIRLMGDSRVNIFYKVIPIFSFIYFLNPIDIPGPIDDIAVLSLGFYLFTEMCPPDVVEEHMKNLRNPDISRIYKPPSPESIVDVDYKEVEQDGVEKDRSEKDE